MYEHYYLGPMKRLDDEVAAYLRAVKMDPLSPSLQAQLGYSYCLKREWNLAIKQCRTALEFDPQCWAHILLGSCYFHIGKHDDAIRAMETQAQVLGRSAFALGNLGWAYASTGRTAEALKLLEEQQEGARVHYNRAEPLDGWPIAFDAVLDCVPNLPRRSHRRLLKRGGGYASTLPNAWTYTLDPLLNRVGNLRRHAVMLRPNEAAMSELLDYLAGGRLRCLIAGEYPLEHAGAAIDASRSGRVVGKLVIRVA